MDGPGGREARGGDPPAAAAAANLTNLTYHLEGRIQGAGSTVAGQSVGQSTPDQPFLVPAGARRLEIAFAWAHPVPHDLALHLVWPDGHDAYVQETDIALTESGLLVTVLDPDAGEWKASGFPNGAAPDVAYTIDILVVVA